MAKHQRASGILLHITSLPSLFGIGDLGPASYRFVDLLADSKQHYWSILPLLPVRFEDCNSPYQTSSAFAGNPLLISPQQLVKAGFLPKLATEQTLKSDSTVDFAAVYPKKQIMLKAAYQNFKKSKIETSEFDAFCSRNEHWLCDYALYSVLRQKTGKPWYEWFPSIRNRELKIITQKQQQLNEEIEAEKFSQYLFFSQWYRLKEYCKTKQISIIGDLPFYIAPDSVDVWMYPELFRLYQNGKPKYVGGVPPDYFSTSGQLWGNPVYDWQKNKETGFEWWINRINHTLTLCDRLRLDHFRGFVAYWQVSAKAETAKSGHWIKTPSNAFFEMLKRTFPSLPFIAEDLGYINEPVKRAIDQLNIPGMRVLLFGLDGSKANPHAPENYAKNSVAYTGTHDTNTVRGWFTTEADAKQRKTLSKLIGKPVSKRDVSFEAVKLVTSSLTDLCILPLQDILGLGTEARMNNPSRPIDNWQWRATEKQLTSMRLAELLEITVTANRD
ncbi:4-alpha-glucanotransferase [Candidatus Bathycorpusculum sp.]|jgi:4-alpha-glucanotransferase|uniref:4-alpha-glucanotransferase n=1 Tax=Candidatus Bathycorpusculum sp. TaxID=2994959 RepID=UPI0028235BB0|nr:4-alpha-glucanotransferase [Candidatus Termitimicrobium sp.]MCL2431343.1 4-alpha-glucanotransferase [Candidatus Termitimicrobium sp.]